MGFIASGVLDRFPDLKIAWIEQGCGWLPFYLDRLEEHYEIMPNFVPEPRKENPQDYFGDQLFICFEPEESDYLPFLEKKVGPDGIIIGSDYSHFDCLSPVSVQRVLDHPELSDESKRKFLSDNPIRFWNLDPVTHKRRVPAEASRAS